MAVLTELLQEEEGMKPGNENQARKQEGVKLGDENEARKQANKLKKRRKAKGIKLARKCSKRRRPRPVKVEPKKKKNKKKNQVYRAVLEGKIRNNDGMWTDVWLKESKSNRNFTNYNLGLLERKYLQVTVTQRGKGLKEWVHQTKLLNGKAMHSVVGIWVCTETATLRIMAVCHGSRVVIFRNADPSKVPLAFHRFLQMKERFTFVHCNDVVQESARVRNWLGNVNGDWPFKMKITNLFTACGINSWGLPAALGYALEGLEIPHHEVLDQNIREYHPSQIGAVAVWVYFVCEFGKAGLAQQPY